MSNTPPRFWTDARLQQWLWDIEQKTQALLQEVFVREGRESMLWWMREMESFAKSDPPPSLADEWHKLDTSSPEAFAVSLWETNPDALRWAKDQTYLVFPEDLDIASLVDLVSQRSTVRTGHGG